MRTYNKQKSIMKNNVSLRSEINKQKEKFKQKYDSLANANEELKKFTENVQKLVSMADKEYIVSEGTHKAQQYIRQKDYTEQEKEIKEKTLTNVEQMYKDVSEGLFKDIVAAKNQTADELQEKNLTRLEGINYSLNNSKSGLAYGSTKEAYDHAFETGKVVAYDLETYGGKSSKTGIWSPRGITEFSFQTLDLNGYKQAGYTGDITKYITKKDTAVIGITKAEGDEWFNKIKLALDNSGTIDDEELRVTAKRFQLYGHAKFSDVNEKGITTITKFPGEEVHQGGYDLEKIKEGIDKLVKVRTDALKYTGEDGILPYHKLMFNTMAEINKSQTTVLDFNGMMFDQPVLNGVTNSIIKNEYANNEKAMGAIKNIFGGSIGFNPAYRIDAMTIFKEAGSIDGHKSILGKNYKETFKNIFKTRTYRQEVLMEAFMPDVMDGMERHIADMDTTNVLRATFEKIDAFDNKSALEHSLDIVDKFHQEKATKIKPEEYAKKIFLSKGEFNSEGRSVLDFSVMPDGSIRTSTNRIINPNSVDEYMKAHKGVSSVNWNTTGGKTKKGVLYNIGDIIEINTNDKTREILTDIAPEYANGRLYSVTMTPYFKDEAQRLRFKEQDIAVTKIFTSKEQAEAFLSDNMKYIGQEGKNVLKYAKLDYTSQAYLNSGTGQAVVGTESKRVNFKPLDKRRHLKFKTNELGIDAKVNYIPYSQRERLKDPITQIRSGVKTKKVKTKEEWNKISDALVAMGKEPLADFDVALNHYAPILKEDGTFVSNFYLRDGMKNNGKFRIKGKKYNLNKPTGFNASIATRKVDITRNYPIDKNTGERIDERTLYKDVEVDAINFYDEKSHEDLVMADVYENPNKELDAEGRKPHKTVIEKNTSPVKTRKVYDANGEAHYIPIQDNSIDLVANYQEAVLNKAKEETAERQFQERLLKRTTQIEEFNKKIEKIKFTNLDKKPNTLKGHLEIARSISKDISNGKAVGKNTDEYKIYEAIRDTLGHEDFTVGKQNLFSNTLNNYIENADKYEQVLPLVSAVKGKMGISGENLSKIDEMRVASVIDDIVDQFASMTYGEDYYLKDEFNKSITMSMNELKNTFHIDVEGFKSRKLGVHKTNSIANTASDANLLRINLESSGPQSLVNKVRELKYGSADANPQANKPENAAVAMIDFVKHLYNQHEDYFEMSETLAQTKKEIIDYSLKRGEQANPATIAENLIKGFKEIKAINPKKGIIAKTQGKVNPLNNGEFRENLLEALNGKGEHVKGLQEAIGTAIDRGPKIKTVKKDDKAFIRDIVEQHFMPTIKSGKETLTGQKALDYILETNPHLNEGINKEVFTTHWNKITESHMKNIEDIANLIFETDGSLKVIDGNLFAAYGDELVEFEGLTKTKFKYGSLAHRVGNTDVMAHLNISSKKTKTGIEMGLESNLNTISKSIREQSYSYKKAFREKTLTTDAVKSFAGRLNHVMRKESVIQSYNVHELSGQNKIGLGYAFGELLPDLVGVEGKTGYLDNIKLHDAEGLKILKEELEKFGTRYKGELTPQMTEVLAKNFIPILEDLDDSIVSQELKQFLPYITASSKDNDVGSKTGVLFHIGDDRYSQRPNDDFDAAKRPTLQAGKIDYDEAKFIKGQEEYMNMPKNKDKFFKVGTIFEDAKKQRAVQGVGINKIENAISVKKANVGNIGLKVILENHAQKVWDENKVDTKTNEMINKILDRVSLQEQEKIADSRLIDNAFEYSANTQHIRNKNMGAYYNEHLNTKKLLEISLNPDKFTEAEVKAAKDELKMADRLANAKLQLKLSKDGKIEAYTPEGSLVRRGEKILPFYDEFNPNGVVSSKIDIGRLQFGVFEEKGNIKLTDKQIQDFLNKNLTFDKTESMESINNKAMKLLEENFKVNYFISDIRQATYAKFMNDAVEKDMTEALFVGIGSTDEKIAKTLEYFKYQGKDLSFLKGQVLKKSEIETIFNNYNEYYKKHNLSEVDGIFKDKESLMKAIDVERHAMSDLLFREVDEFKDVSLIANHQVAKHNNQGMIADNVIGSIYESILKQKDKNGNPISQKDALEKLQTKLIEYNVFDAKTLELDSDGKTIFIKPKPGNTSHSKYNFTGEGEDILKDVRYLNMGGLKELIDSDEDLKHLHKKVNYFDASTKTIKSKDVYGEVETVENFVFDGTNYKNVAVMSKGITVLQQAVDPETMTRYDYSVGQGLKLRAEADALKIDAQVAAEKEFKRLLKDADPDTLSEKRYMELVEQSLEHENVVSLLTKAELKNTQARDLLDGIEEFARPKTIGKQEFGLYNKTKWNYSAEEVVNRFLKMPTAPEDIIKFREEFVENNMSTILRLDKDLKEVTLDEKLINKSALKRYTDDLILGNIYNKKTVELTDDRLELEQFKHLKSVVSDIKDRIVSDFGIDKEDAKVGYDYAEKLYQAKNAVLATKFNQIEDRVQNQLSVKQMEEAGFKKVSFGDLAHIGIDERLSTVGAAGDLDIPTIFNSNNLLYLGEDFGVGPQAYIALPKAGKSLEDHDIDKLFQSSLKSLESLQREYYEGNFVRGSEEGEKLKNRIVKKANEVRELVNNYTYDKNGILHDLSKVETDEAFRLKFSFVNNSDAIDNIKGNINAEVIDRNSKLLEKAMINGTSIAELEKNGIFTDYAFVSKNVFEDLGYFEDEKLNDLAEVKTGKLILDKEKLTEEQYKANKRKAQEIMSERLQTDGILANTGRYPMIMTDSEKASRIFLGEDVQNNRARVSVVTALSMNADNDGDSASFSTLKLRDKDGKGVNYISYRSEMQMAKEANPNATPQQLREAVRDRMGESNAKFFEEMEARMAVDAIGKNQYYHGKSLDDLYGELDTAIANGTINTKNQNLFKEFLYANNGEMPDTKVMEANKNRLNMYVDKVREANKKYNLGFDLDMTPIDIDKIKASTKNAVDLATYYDRHLEVLGAMDNKQLEEMGLGAGAKLDFRQNAIARTMWMDSLAETQSKGRKSSIGPINVSLQGIRAGADALYQEDASEAAYKSLHIAQELALELEQEVISAKHGNVVTQITKARDLKQYTDDVIYKRDEASKTLLKDFFNGTGNSDAANIDNKTVKKIWEKLEYNGIISMKDLDGSFRTSEDLLSAKRDYLINSYINTLTDIGRNRAALDARELNKVGGSGATYKNYKTTLDATSSMGDFANSVINKTKYDNKVVQETVTDDIMNMHVMRASAAIDTASEVITSIGSGLKGKGLAMGALSVAVGVLASGFAGSPVSQEGASELAHKEETNKSTSGGVPSFIDQGAEVTRSSNRGYIINMKANSSKDIRNTKRAIRTAAAESAGGGVNVNMTIRDKRREISDADIEQWITGL